MQRKGSYTNIHVVSDTLHLRVSFLGQSAMRCQNDLIPGKPNLKHKTHIYNLKNILLKFEGTSGITKRIDSPLCFVYFFPLPFYNGVLSCHFKKKRRNSGWEGFNFLHWPFFKSFIPHRRHHTRWVCTFNLKVIRMGYSAAFSRARGNKDEGWMRGSSLLPIKMSNL